MSRKIGGGSKRFGVVVIGTGSVFPHSEYQGNDVMLGTQPMKRIERMASIEEIGQEKQRISERLARLDAERTRLADQLNELEIAERVLTRFGAKAGTTGGRRRGRPARTASAGDGERRARGVQKAPSLTLSDACLKAVQAHGEGATANEVLNYLSSEFGMTVRPNHLRAALQRHRRAGQLENRAQRWYPPS
jgi:hypothetical protein